MGQGVSEPASGAVAGKDASVPPAPVWGGAAGAWVPGENRGPASSAQGGWLAGSDHGAGFDSLGQDVEFASLRQGGVCPSTGGDTGLLCRACRAALLPSLSQGAALPWPGWGGSLLSLGRGDSLSSGRRAASLPSPGQ